MKPDFEVGDIVRLIVLNMIGRVDYVRDRIGVKTPGNAFSVEPTDIELVSPEVALLYMLENR